MSSLPFTLSDPSLFQCDAHIDGDFVPSLSARRFPVLDPATGRSWASVSACTPLDVDPAVTAAQAAFTTYSRLLPHRRAELLFTWHALILAAKPDLATLLVAETGKPLAEAHGEVDYALTFVWWFAGEAERAAHGSTLVSSTQPGRRALVIKQPLGVAAALVPWNFPVALLLRKAACALAAGCTVVAKPSPESPVSALALAQLARRAGFPPGALTILPASLEGTPQLAEALCAHPLIRKVSFTGSTQVGRIVASQCAAALTKCTLELGGNCPFVVFDDANLEGAAAQLLALKWRHAGQACITANRVFVQDEIYDTFVDRLVRLTRDTIRLGHGLAEGTTMGPLTTAKGLEKAERLVADALGRGAKLILGQGQRVQGSEELRGGYFMEPIVLGEMTDEMQISQEEVFAPVLAFYRFSTEEEAVRRANMTPLGLASYVFTQDVDRMWRMFENLEAGMVGLNSGNSSAADAPFGGIKDSGLGKESGKDVAMDEYLTTKTGTLTVGQHF